MTIQASGQIKLSEVATEFGGTAPHALSEYYDSDTGVPASGQIKISEFYSTANAVTFTFSGNYTGFNLKGYMDSNSITAKPIINVTYSSGTLGGNDSTSSVDAGRVTQINISHGVRAESAMTVDGFASGTTINFINQGTMLGGGGRGGDGYCSSSTNSGSPGGNAITVDGSYTFNINNGSGTLKGGGGGGEGNTNGGSYGLCKQGGAGEGYNNGNTDGAIASHGSSAGQSGGSYGNSGSGNGGTAGYYTQALNGASISFSSNGTRVGLAP